MRKTISQTCQEYPAEFPSEQSLYRAVRENILPPGVAVRIGRRMLINTDKLQQWLDNGGQALPGGWKRESH
ncbi:MAG: helix-turn-helix domain-containing protein [Acidobacteria bacterium]|nr:helix-turn-helix domain-containing protein [Acidobacteriota bacterium]